MKRLLAALLLTGAAVAVAGWFLSAPDPLSSQEVAALGTGDAVRGERMFWAGGCASCHAAPGADGDARLQMAGGLELKTPFGTFVPPNISSDPTDGIGNWSLEQFANAMLRGVAPDGSHYYPAFPYGSYTRMHGADVADLYAFMKTLPAVQGRAADNQLSFPFNIRRSLGLWKLLYLDPAPVVAVEEAAGAKLELGRYLVEGPGHCGECHTPRAMFGAGGPDESRWLAGAPAAAGSGNVPNITPAKLSWSESEIVTYLQDGTTPDFDFVGGEMASVVKNMAHLAPEDREAIAAYLKAVPPRE